MIDSPAEMAGAAKLIPLKKASETFGVSETTLFRWVRHGRLKAYTKPGTGHVTYLDESELRRLTKPQAKA